MKVQLVVVQGKPEGKTIPLTIPKFKIGRGDGCHLRPNHDQVSREHAIFEVATEAAFIQDLGSRNGTELNGKKIPANEPQALKNGDLVKIGPLTFAVSIEGLAPVVVVPPSKKPVAIDDIPNGDIDSWLVSDAAHEPPDRPSGVYGGETMTIETLKFKERPPSKPIIPVAAPVPEAIKPAPPVTKAPEPEPAPESEEEPEAEGRVEDEIEFYSPDADDDGIEDLAASSSKDSDMPDEMIDESNPFYVKKKVEAAPVAAAKGPQKDSSDAANDILRRMMDRRKASKS